MTFSDNMVDTLIKVWDKETTTKLKETVIHYEEEIARVQKKVDILNHIIYTRENK